MATEETSNNQASKASDHAVVPMPPDTYPLSVTEHDIAAGERNDCENCAVARAINREYPALIVEARHDGVHVMHDGVGKSYDVDWYLANWMNDYDNDCEVQPFDTILYRA